MFANCYVGNPVGYGVIQSTSIDVQAMNTQPIAVPAISVDELKEITKNFGPDALIGEGSFGRVYYGVLASGQAAAIKNLDSSRQPNQEFLAQVRPTEVHYVQC